LASRKFIVNGQLMTVPLMIRKQNGVNDETNENSKKYKVNGQLVFVPEFINLKEQELVTNFKIVNEIMNKIFQKNIAQRICCLSVDMGSSLLFSMIQKIDNSFKVLLGAQKLNQGS
jgi:hypothetical protein